MFVVLASQMASCISAYDLSSVKLDPGKHVCIERIEVKLGNHSVSQSDGSHVSKNHCSEINCGKIVERALPPSLARCPAESAASSYPLVISAEGRTSNSVNALMVFTLLTLWAVPMYVVVEGDVEVTARYRGQVVARWKSDISEMIWRGAGIVPIVSGGFGRSSETIAEIEDTIALQRIADSIAEHVDLLQAVYARLHGVANPAELHMTAKLSALRDGKLNAGDTAQLEVSLEQTAGQAPREVQLTAFGGNDLTVATATVRGLSRGHATTTTLEVRADRDASDGVRRILLTADPGVGRAQKLAIDVPVSSRLPHLGAALVELNDGRSGNALGNGNGKIDAKESVELTFVVYNEGPGTARQTAVSAVSEDANLDAEAGPPKYIGDLSAGASTRVTFLLSVKPHFSGRLLPYRLNLTAQPAKQSRTISPLLTLGDAPKFDVVPHLQKMNGAVVADAAPSQPIGPMRGLPPQLTIEASDVKLEDADHNNALDAGEAGALVVRIHNGGKGTAQGVSVDAQLTAAPGLTIKRITNVVGPIAPGGDAIVHIPVLADEERATDATVSATLTAREPHGYDSEPTQVRWQVHALEAPKLEVAFVKFDDSRKGLAAGDADGKFNLGETVELTFTVVNSGRGSARNVRVRLDPDADGVNVVEEFQRQEIGTLPSGSTKDVAFAVSVSKSFKSVTVPLHLEVSEERPRFSTRLAQTLPIDQHVKDLQVVTIHAANRGDSSQAAVEITGDPVETPPSAADGRFANAIALVVGIEEYQAKIAKAVHAEDDANLMADYFVRSFGIPSERVHRIIGSYATKSAFEAELAWLKENANPDAPVLFYYGGHGSPETQGSTQGNAYVLPWDGRPGDLARTALTRDGLLGALGAIPASDVYAFFDACYSGGGGRSVIPASMRPLISAKLAVPKSGHLVVFGAADSDQTAGAHPRAAHGLFTYYLLNALRGAADFDRDGVVRLLELRDYVVREVSAASRLNSGHAQVPQLIGGQLNAPVLRVGGNQK